MSDIELSRKSLSAYDHITDTIILGTEFKSCIESLTFSDFNTFLVDTITHEFLHGLLEREFNLIVSRLFDSIEYLIGDFKLKSKVFSMISKQHGDNKYFQTWHDYIIQNGFDAFMCDYHLSKDAINEAFILYGGRQ